MQIGIISDSHFDSKHLTENSFLPLFTYLKHLFAHVDRIIHAGDVCTEHFIDILTQIAPVSAVKGNMDRNSKLPESLCITVDKITIGVVHQIESISSLSIVPRILIYGHTHIAEIKEETDTYLLINPGSLTQPRIGNTILPFPMKRPSPSPIPTVALLMIEEDILSAYLEKIPPKYRFLT